MPLEYADFAHYYDGQGLSDGQSRAHFTAFADLMENIARVFWQDGPSEIGLGIIFDDDILMAEAALESAPSNTALFNAAAAYDEAGKKEP